MHFFACPSGELNNWCRLLEYLATSVQYEMI